MAPEVPSTRSPSSLALLSDTEIDTLPLRTFQSKDEKADTKALQRLWKDMDLGNLNEFLDYLSLFPREFRLLGHKQTQKLNDHALLKIFSSETGQKSLCFLASKGTKELRQYLGLSLAAAKSVKNICQERNRSLSEAEKSMFDRMHRFSPLRGSVGQPLKKVIFLLNEGAPPEIEAFTTKQNTSVFILPRNDLSETRIVRMLAHELAMSYDQFSWIGDSDSALGKTWQTGMGVIYGLPLFDPKNPGKYSAYFKEGPAPKIRCVLYDLPIRYALATERAFRFEDQIARELGISAGDLGGASLSCEENIRRWLPFYPRFQSFLGFENFVNSTRLEAECGEVLDGLPVSERNAALNAIKLRLGGKALKDFPAADRKKILEQTKEALRQDSLEHEAVYRRIQERLGDLENPDRQKLLAERIATLRDTELESKAGDTKVNLCRLLQEPRVGPHYPSFFYGGPRPRAGGWLIKNEE